MSAEEVMQHILAMSADLQVKVAVLLWQWWNERNRVREGDKGRTDQDLAFVIIKSAEEFLKQNKQHEKGEGRNLKKWSKPPIGILFSTPKKLQLATRTSPPSPPPFVSLPRVILHPSDPISLPRVVLHPSDPFSLPRVILQTSNPTRRAILTPPRRRSAVSDRSAAIRSWFPRNERQTAIVVSHRPRPPPNPRQHCSSAAGGRARAKAAALGW